METIVPKNSVRNALGYAVESQTAHGRSMPRLQMLRWSCNNDLERYNLPEQARTTGDSNL
jgi:hypothetical protein